MESADFGLEQFASSAFRFFLKKSMKISFSQNQETSISLAVDTVNKFGLI